MVSPHNPSARWRIARAIAGNPKPSDVLMVGDNLATDIAGASGSNLHSLLVVESGVHAGLSADELAEPPARLSPARPGRTNRVSAGLVELGSIKSRGGKVALKLAGARDAGVPVVVAINRFTTDTQAEFDTYLAGVLSGLDNLAGDVSNTVKNSKRVTVAVTVEARNGVAPIQPLWMTSVVRDPSAGLLSSGSAACQ